MELPSELVDKIFSFVPRGMLNVHLARPRGDRSGVRFTTIASVPGADLRWLWKEANDERVPYGNRAEARQSVLMAIGRRGDMDFLRELAPGLVHIEWQYVLMGGLTRELGEFVEAFGDIDRTVKEAFMELNAQRCRVDELRWGLSRGFPPPEFHTRRLLTGSREDQLRTLEFAVEHGFRGTSLFTCSEHPDVVRRALALGCEVSTFAVYSAVYHNNVELFRSLPWDPAATIAVVVQGNVEILADVHEYSWDGFTNIAAAAGQVAAIRWAVARGCPWHPDTTSAAARNGHVAVLEYVIAHGCPWHPDTTAVAVRHGFLDLARWAVERGCPWGKETTAIAARFGHREFLEWAVARGCPWAERTTYAAASAGLLEVLQWVVANGCPWHPDTAAGAAESWRVDVLAWCAAQQHTRDHSVTREAATAGDVKMLRWAHENGFPLHRTILQTAVHDGDIDVIRFARQHGIPWPDQCTVFPARSGRLDVLQEIVRLGCPWDSYTAIAAAYRGHIEVVQWALAHGCPRQRFKVAAVAEACGYPKLAAWARAFDATV